MKKLTSIIIITLLSYLCTTAQIIHPKHEIRAVWLTTLGGLDWPKTYAVSTAAMKKQQKELRDILDKLQAADINCVLFQTRTRSAVLYPSKYESWAPCVAGRLGKAPGYDPLAFAVEECHRRGMELHAWVTTIPAGRWNSAECKQLRRELPGTVKRNGDQGYMEPSSNKTASYLSDLCSEITRNYDVDGIHLDYIRYPENIRIRTSATAARRNITDIVRKIYFDVKAIKPWVKVSCSPIGKYSDLSRYSSRGWNARDKVFQDAQAWLSDGIMDILFPMMYFRNDHFYPFLFDWNENKHSGNIAAGLGAYMLSPKEGNWKIDEITRQMYVARDNETGYAFFRSKFFTDDVKGIYSFTKDIFNAYPALMPQTKCHGIEHPIAPKSIDVRYSGDYYIVSWQQGEWFDKSPYCTYNLYASNKYPVDTDDARNLIRCRTKELNAAVKRNSNPVYFAVTTNDRYGNESAAMQQICDYAVTDEMKGMIICNDKKIVFDDLLCDIEYIIVETLTGNIVLIPNYNKEGIDMSNVAPGMYILRTLNKRGISHRIGFMLKK